MNVNELAAVLARQQMAKGGTTAQRASTASLWLALVFHESVELVRALKREDIDALILEDFLGFTLQVGAASIRFVRNVGFSPDTISLSLCGLDHVVPYEHSRPNIAPGARSIEETVSSAGEFMAALDALLRRANGAS